MAAKEINADCPCTADCHRHGDCDACQAYHANSQTTCQKQGKDKK